ncbi:MAG: cell division protein SepF [Oscillospiraceae bacterium]|nr:cell division protein SepF [Oscillospiraceae bacterium]
MSIWNKIVDFVAPKEDDGDEVDTERDSRSDSKWSRESKEAREAKPAREDASERTSETPRAFRYGESGSYASAGSAATVRAAAPSTDHAEQRSKVVNIQATAQLQVVLVKPEVYSDAKQIADHLIAKRTVVLNLETADASNKRRIIDFLVGVAYANGGSLKPVANLTYIITPYNVGFIGEDLVNELESNGVSMM